MKFVFTICTLLSLFTVFAQDKNTGSIQGKVIDGITGETIPGVIVELIPNSTKTSSDLDGKYNFNKLQKGTYSIKVIYTEFPTQIITEIPVNPNEVTSIDVTMKDTTGAAQVDEVVITARRNYESVNVLLLQQKNAASVSDGISAETIKRTPDKTTSDVLKRVSGASIQENKFAVIRGLNDRYNAAFLNGAPLPSTESDRKAFSFDIFPANMLENLVITKTATPDQPAEFAGGIIQITTKGIPDKKFFTVAGGAGYNTITTFKPRQSYKGGKTDWIGIDDGSRKLSGEVPSYENYPLNINDQAALAQKFTTSWGSEEGKFNPNFNFQVAMGANPKLFNKEFGVISSITYNRTFNYNETVRKSYTNSPDGETASQVDTEYLDKNNSEQTLAGVMLNFTMKLNENNSIGFKNLLSVNSDDRYINRTGSTNPLESNPTLLRSNARWFTSNTIYTGQLNGEHLLPKTKLRINWLASTSSIKRSIPSLNRSIYTRLQSINDPSDPNPLDTQYVANISFTNVGPSYGGGMFFSETKENSTNARLDVTYPTTLFGKIKSEIKIGAFTQFRNRDFAARQLGYTRYGIVGGNIDFKQSLLYLPEDEIFAAENMGLLQAPQGGMNGVGGFKLTDGTKFSDAYQAQSQLNAGYLMLDNRFGSQFRLVWGARAEAFNQKLQALKDDNSKLEINTNKLDILPSANLIFSATKKANVRLSYSQTINRPEYRELAPFAFYDFNTNFVVSGNDSLLRAKINNLDLRYEFFAGRGQIISATAFYKHFTNPIEQISRADVTSEISYKNVPTGENYGVEFEIRTLLSSALKLDTSSFFDNLTVYSNLSIIRSVVDVRDVVGSLSDTRPLQGQSPYVFNAGLQYQNREYNWGASLNLNRVGPRIFIVGNQNEPDLWENSRTFLDFQISKTFWGNKAEFKINCQNILAQKQEFYQNSGAEVREKGFNSFFNSVFVGDKNNRTGLDAKTDDVVWSTKFGRSISASLSVRF